MPAVKDLSVTEMHRPLGGKADHIHLRTELEDLLRPRIAERMQEIPQSATDEDDMELRSASTPTPPLQQGPGLGGAGWRMPLDSEAVGPLGRPAFRPEGFHRAGPPMSAEDNPSMEEEQGGSRMQDSLGLVSRPEDSQGLRVAAAATSDKGTVAVPSFNGPAGKQGGMTFPFQEVTLKETLVYTRFSYCAVIWLCWLRCFPLTACFTPKLVQLRATRAAALSLYLAVTLALATGLASVKAWSHVASEEIVASSRSFVELLTELDAALAMPEILPLGVLCALIGGAIASSWTPAPVLSKLAGPAATESLPGKKSWYSRVRRRLKLGGVFAVLLCGMVLASAMVLAANIPQPRGAVALGFFVVALLWDFALIPVLRTLSEALLVCIAGRAWCGAAPADFLASQLPSLLDFRLAQLWEWTTADSLLERVKAIAEEQRLAEALAAGEAPPQPLGVKPKRVAEPERIGAHTKSLY